MAAVTICSDFGAPLPPKKSLSLFPLFPHLFAMKWWDQIPGSKNTFYISVVKHILFDSQFGDHDWIIHIPPRCWLLSPLVERGRLVQSPGCQSVSQGTTEGSWLNKVLMVCSSGKLLEAWSNSPPLLMYCLNPECFLTTFYAQEMVTSSSVSCFSALILNFPPSQQSLWQSGKKIPHNLTAHLRLSTCYSLWSQSKSITAKPNNKS